MGIEITSGGVSKTFRYYPYDAFYIDANGNLNTSGNGQQVMEAWFNGVKYYPEGNKPPARIAVMNQPRRADYSDIIVVAYTADNEVWYDPNHPNGIIPFNELEISKRGAFTTECAVSPQDTNVTHNSDVHIGGPARGKLQSCLGEVMYTPITYVAGDSAAVNSERFYSLITDNANWTNCYGYFGQDVYAVAVEYRTYNNYSSVAVGFFVPFTYDPMHPYIESVDSYGRLQHPKGTGNVKCTIDTNIGKDGMWSGSIKEHSTIKNTHDISSFEECPGSFTIGNKAVYCLYRQSYVISLINSYQKEIIGNAIVYTDNNTGILRSGSEVLYGVTPFEKTQDSPNANRNYEWHLACAFWNWYYGGPVGYDVLRVSWRGHSEIKSVDCATNLRQIA